MTRLTEKLHAGGFIFSEGDRGLSRDAGLLIAGQNLEVGTVLGKLSASGKYTILAPAAVDGSEQAAAILLAAVDASGGDRSCVVVSRSAQVFGNELTWPAGIADGDKATAIAQLQALGVVVRN